MSNNRIIQVLHIRPFFFLWLSEVISQVAMNMVNFILIILAFKLSHSNTAVSGIVIAYTIPAIFFGIFAGIYVDRWSKKKVLFATNIIRALLVILLVFFHSSLLAVYILTFLVSIVTQFFIPAETPMIPVIVEKKLLHSANALFGMGIYGSVLIAYVLSGAFLIWFGQQNVFFVLSCMFLLAAFCINFIHVRAKKLEADKHLLPTISQVNVSVHEEMRSLFRIIAKTKKVYDSLLLLCLSQLVILIIAVIGPGYASQVLHIEVEEFPLLFIAPAAMGMVLGTIVLGTISHQYPKEKSVSAGIFLSALCIFFLPFGSKVASQGFIHSFNTLVPNIFDITIMHFMMFLAFLLGIANALVFVPSNTTLQEETSEEIRGKVYGALNSLIGIISLAPVIIVGSLSDVFGVAQVLSGIGIFLFLIALWRVIRL